MKIIFNRGYEEFFVANKGCKKGGRPVKLSYRLLGERGNYFSVKNVSRN